MKKVALVEDHPDNRLVVRIMLRSHYDVQEYENGPDALSGLAGDKPDLVLMDISLPGMDGLEVLRRMKEDAQLRDIPVIAFTAHAMKDDEAKFLAAGFDGYVSKPVIGPDELLTSIARCIGER